MLFPPPSLSSLAHRESIARLLTPLRRIRPTVAYYKLAAHRIPTLWTLYRGLQRNAERENVGGVHKSCFGHRLTWHLS